jgi:hypothetical protein
MALKYNEKTGEFEKEISYSSSNSSSNERQKNKIGCIGSLFLSLMYGLGAWTIGFFVLLILFPNASDDTGSVLIVINFIISAIVVFFSFSKTINR